MVEATTRSFRAVWRGAMSWRRDRDLDGLALRDDHAGVEPGHVEKIAHEAIKPLGLGHAG